MLDLTHVWEFIGPASPSYWEGRVPATDPDEYRRDSPVHHAAKVRTPLLLIHGGKDRKSTRLNSSHANNSYAVFCLKKKKNNSNNHSTESCSKRRNYFRTA